MSCNCNNQPGSAGSAPKGTVAGTLGSRSPVIVRKIRAEHGRNLFDNTKFRRIFIGTNNTLRHGKYNNQRDAGPPTRRPTCNGVRCPPMGGPEAKMPLFDAGPPTRRPTCNGVRCPPVRACINNTRPTKVPASSLLFIPI